MISASIPFHTKLKQSGLSARRNNLRVVQVNVGKLCNQACLHCHVEAGPKRTEIMLSATGDRIAALLRSSSGIQTLDITGGAPELNSNFKPLVLAARELGLEVIDRCNLTVFFEPGQEDLPIFLANNSVRVIASLPCYSKENVEQQRGSGVFKKSIDALLKLNSLGYGKKDSGLILDLVYNPLGATLPPPQSKLEADYKKELGLLFGIEFNQLFTITNIPISRFLHQLQRENKLESYMELLLEKFNPHAAAGIMCRDLISVSWDGGLYDCDFNQMLELPIFGKHKSIWEIDSFKSAAINPIVFGNHCYACTAGAGSSCTGSLDDSNSMARKSALAVLPN